MSIQLISRYNHDIKRVADAEEIEIKDSEITWRPKTGGELKLEFCSIHKSKGITRDVVIVLNMNDDLYGMPAQKEMEPLLDILLSSNEAFAFAEERRLFYVAITRARKITYLICRRKNPSPFLYEISNEIVGLKRESCPRCNIGTLIKKEKFQYCSNYAYGCNYLKRFT